MGLSEIFTAFRLPRPLLVIHFTAILSTLSFTPPAFGNEPSTPDIFDLIGSSPAEVAASTIHPSRTDDSIHFFKSFAGLPMSAIHRKEFIESLRNTIRSFPDSSYIAQLSLIAVLEEDARFDDAIAYIRSMPVKSDEARIQEIALCWKAGRPDEAKKLAQTAPSMRFQAHWLNLIQIDLNQGRLEEAIHLLDFIQSLDDIPTSIRYRLAIQHLDIARQLGKADELIESTPSPTYRAIWNSALNRTEQANEAIKQCDTEGSDIEFLAQTLGSIPLVEQIVAEILARPALPLERRRSLLAAISGPGQRFKLWSTMKDSHAETVDVFDYFPSASTHEQQLKDLQTCTDLLKANPQDYRLKWLIANMPPNTPQSSLPLLRDVARAFKEKSEGNHIFADPAVRSLRILAKLDSPADMKDLVVNAPGFSDLPSHSRLRYLMAADLGHEVLATLATCDFKDRSFSSLTIEIARFIRQQALSKALTEESLQSVFKQLPEIILGSPDNTDQSIRYNTAEWLNLLGSHSTDEAGQTRIILNLTTTAAQRSPEAYAAVLAGIPDFAWKLPGLDLQKPEKKPNPPQPARSPVYQALSIFTPAKADIIGQASPSSSNTWFPDLPGSTRGTPLLHLLASSPWAQNIRDLRIGRPLDPALLAKVRTLLTNTPSRTLIYDLLVTTGTIDCPDPAIKTNAEKRIAALDTKQIADPSLTCFLFCHKLSNKQSLDDCLPMLDGLHLYPRPAIQRAITAAADLAENQHPGARERMFEQVKFKYPKPPNPSPQPPAQPSPYDRLQFFIAARKTATPEAISLARQVLFDFVDSNRPSLTPTQNIAISILHSEKKFDALLADLKSKMQTAGRSEMEIQRTFYRLHCYRIVHSENESEPFARRIFTLDPTDTEVLGDVLSAAIREKDSPTALKVIESICRHDPARLNAAMNAPEPNVLGLLSGPLARDLAITLLRTPAIPPPPSHALSQREYTLHPLFRHIAKHDPTNLKPILNWAGEISPTNSVRLIALVDSLEPDLTDEGIVELLASAFFTPNPGIASLHIGFGAPPPGIFPSTNFFHLSQFTRGSLAKQLAAVSSDFPPSDSTAGIKLLFQIAADPTPENWNNRVPDFIAKLPIATRDQALSELRNHLKNLPNSDALQYFLANQSDPSNPQPITLNALLNKIILAAKIKQRDDIPQLWAAAKPLLSTEDNHSKINFLIRASPHLATLADPTVWNDFVTIIRETKDISGQWFTSYRSFSQDSYTPERAADLARIILPDFTVEFRNVSDIIQLFDRVVESDKPDLELLEKFRPWLSHNNLSNQRGLLTSSRLQWLDLIISDLAAVSPQIHASPRDDSTWDVDWSLAGFKGTRSGYPAARPFSHLDQEFDLEILAGPATERLTRIASVPRAKATGRLHLTLPPDTKFISILARQSDGEIVRWSHPFSIESAPHSRPIDLSPPTTSHPGGENIATRIPSGGPFLTEDAWKFALPPQSKIELARLPWTEGPAPVVSGWIQKSHTPGTVSLSFRSIDGIEIRNEPLSNSENELVGLPFWQRFKTPANLMAPNETATVTLMLSASDSNRPSSARLSGVRCIHPKDLATPDGFTKLGRIHGEVCHYALESNSTRIAFNSPDSGVGTFDLATGEFSGWIPVIDPKERRQKNAVWMAISGDHIACLLQDGGVYHISVPNRTSKLIHQIHPFDSSNGNAWPIQLSPDGKFLAVAGLMAGMRIIEFNDNGAIRERLLETGQINQIDISDKSVKAFTNDKISILDLRNWQDADLTVRQSLPGDKPRDKNPLITANNGKVLSIPSLKVRLEAYSQTTKLYEFKPESRVITLQSGLLAIDHQNKPLYISSYGTIYRIDVEKLKEYQNPPQN